MNADVTHQLAELMLQFASASFVLPKEPPFQFVLAFVCRCSLKPTSLICIQRLQDLIQIGIVGPLGAAIFVSVQNTEEQHSDCSFALHRGISFHPGSHRRSERIQDLVLDGRAGPAIRFGSP